MSDGHTPSDLPPDGPDGLRRPVSKKDKPAAGEAPGGKRARGRLGVRFG